TPAPMSTTLDTTTAKPTMDRERFTCCLSIVQEKDRDALYMHGNGQSCGGCASHPHRVARIVLHAATPGAGWGSPPPGTTYAPDYFFLARDFLRFFGAAFDFFMGFLAAFFAAFFATFFTALARLAGAFAFAFFAASF